MNLILCGLPRSGKSTLGKALATKLNWPLIDTDTLLGESPGNLYREIGEQAFRFREEEVIAGLKGVHSTVIVLGGGALMSVNNQKVVKNLGIVIYLKTPLEVIQQRIDSELSKPGFLESLSLEQLAFMRCPVYEAAADIITTGKGEEATWVETLLEECFESRRGGSPTGLRSAL